MTWDSLPWTEIAVAVPLIGAVTVSLLREREAASQWCLAFTALALLCSGLPWLVVLVHGEQPSGLTIGEYHLSLLNVDRFSGPLLPLVALLHALTALSTPRAEASRSSFAFLLVSESIQLATFASSELWLLVALLSLGTIPPLAELILHKKPWRIFAIHMGLFVGLLIIGSVVIPTSKEAGAVALMIAILIRSGTTPVHLWMADLFEHASFGSSLLFVAPLVGVYAAVRLILPTAPDWILQGLGLSSLITALYAAAMAVVQRDARRFLAYLFLSHASFVMVGLELHTAISLTGALCLWVSVALSLGGVGITLRALEARFGRLSLIRHHGLYPQSPALAVCFIVTGLTSVGFPGTLGFIAAELLADGVVDAVPLIGVGLILAGALTGVAVLRGYLLLFTGIRREASASLAITLSERFAVLCLAGLVLGGGLMPQPGIVDRHAVAEALLSRRMEKINREMKVPTKGHEE